MKQFGYRMWPDYYIKQLLSGKREREREGLREFQILDGTVAQLPVWAAASVRES